jgi:hypothetical protein
MRSTHGFLGNAERVAPLAALGRLASMNEHETVRVSWGNIRRLNGAAGCFHTPLYPITPPPVPQKLRCALRRYGKNKQLDKKGVLHFHEKNLKFRVVSRRTKKE